MQDYQILADLFGRYHEKSAGNPDEMACKPCKENWREFSIRREGESKMSLDAIEKVTEIEQQMRELRANADAQVQKVKADAERDGQARLVQARAAAAEEGKARVYAVVMKSPVLFGWLAQFGGRIRIEKPASLAQEYRAYLEDIVAAYE